MLLSIAGLANLAAAQNAALSTHMTQNWLSGDILVNQVRVPAAGATTYTYYETLGWGADANGQYGGYAGIQDHPDGRNFIFSIWDNLPGGNTGITFPFVGSGTETAVFGGEGTGARSLNFQLGWQTDVWYTLAARSWAANNDHTNFGFWVHKPDSNSWHHLITMNAPTSDGLFRDYNNQFIEDWLETGENQREVNFRGAWTRDVNGVWHASQEAYYALNANDQQPGGRAYNYRNNYDAGVGADATGPYYFMKSGGTTAPSPGVNPPQTFTLAQSGTAPSSTPIQFTIANASLGNNSLVVEWNWLVSTTPQFSFEVKVFNNPNGTGTPLLSASGIEPDIRRYQLDASSLGAEQYYVRLGLTDIFGRSVYSDSLITASDSFTADFNNDLHVNSVDFNIWKTGFGTGNAHAQGDADGNGAVDGADLLAWQRQFGAAGSIGQTVAVPEPQGLALVAAAIGSLFTGRFVRPFRIACS